MHNARPDPMKAVVSLTLIVFAIAYPFIVYWHIDKVAPGWYAAALLLLIVIRFFFLADGSHKKDRLMAFSAAAFCLIVMLLNSVVMLKFYPVLMSVGMGLMFIGSLTDSQSLIERFARAGGKSPPEAARGYLRTLSLCWGILLIANGAIAAYTAWFSSMATWTLYNGLISYLLIGCFVVAELVFRGYYKKRHNIVDNE